LEEIRQKRAAQRLSKASSGPDLSEIPNPAGNFIHLQFQCFAISFSTSFAILIDYFIISDFPVIRKSESGNRLSEVAFLCLSKIVPGDLIGFFRIATVLIMRMP
jgi:hypothetical protein